MKYSVLTPNTKFALRIDPRKEEKLLRNWDDVYDKLSSRPDSDLFLLHDGPPYANGHLHIGHALNKILKDATNRFQSLYGKRIDYVPGWDCHGLPIEWAVEQQYRKEGKNKDDNVIEFRQRCRQYALEWIETQKQEFKRLGVIADWNNPYTTMNYNSEAKIVEQFYRFLDKGLVYRANKPIMWSPIEKTALAEAEVEHKKITSTSAYVKFAVVPDGDFLDTSIVIWTTTPWTIPGNEAVAFSDKVDYGFYTSAIGNLILSNKSAQELDIKHLNFVEDIFDDELAEMKLVHPMYDKQVPMLVADFVTDEQGTGFVHIAPGHGMDDFLLGQKHGLPLDSVIDDNACYRADMDLVAGIHVFKADKEILSRLEANGALVETKKITHDYPHSWRSKKPVIYRTTLQWFIDIGQFKEQAFNNVDKVSWFPETGGNRLKSTIGTRTEWCISRQRVWGVPIAVFVDKHTGEVLSDAAVNEKVISEFKLHGCDVWFEKPSSYFLTDQYNPDDYDMIMDVMDVWFDSGASWWFVLDGKVADLYLEGSDQHRGWFQSSLLISTALTGVAPYKNVLTHGFCLDGAGKKMSKSDGNVIAPDEVIKKHGADVLRVWTLGSSFMEDLRISDGILDQAAKTTKLFRNTLRFLLGNLNDSDVVLPMSYDKLPSLEKYMLHQLYDLDSRIKVLIGEFKYNHIVTALKQFCDELSSFYFDIRKDCLYCDSVDNNKRKSCLFVLALLFDRLSTYLMPIIPFTIADVSALRWPNEERDSLFVDLDGYKNVEIFNQWQFIKTLRSLVLKELENSRRNIDTNLAAWVALCLTGNAFNVIKEIDFAEVLIVSDVSISRGKTHIHVSRHTGDKCDRCWQYFDQLNNRLCDRCMGTELNNRVMITTIPKKEDEK